MFVHANMTDCTFNVIRGEDRDNKNHTIFYRYPKTECQSSWLAIFTRIQGSWVGFGSGADSVYAEICGRAVCGAYKSEKILRHMRSQDGSVSSIRGQKSSDIGILRIREVGRDRVADCAHTFQMNNVSAEIVIIFRFIIMHH
jgi:hypothetical protein